jgi:hypothetical protein
MLKIEMETEELGRIFDREVYAAVSKGDVIEEYPDDTPYPSILIIGRTPGFDNLILTSKSGF